MTEEEEKLVKVKDQADLDASVASMKKANPEHSIKEFTLTHSEQQLLAQQTMIKSLAEIAIDGIVNNVIVKRIGIPSDPAVHITYSIGLGRFVAFIPKELKGGVKKN